MCFFPKTPISVVGVFEKVVTRQLSSNGRAVCHVLAGKFLTRIMQMGGRRGGRKKKQQQKTGKQTNDGMLHHSGDGVLPQMFPLHHH